MPSKRIQGITIEIDGNTQKLNSALKDVDRQLSSTQSQLKDVEKLLKLDPKNTELLSQKQKLLTEAIGGTKDRLAQLEKAQADLAKRDSTPEVTKQQEALQREIIATKKQLEGFEDELGKVPSKASLAFNSIGEGLDKAGQKMSSVGEGMTKYVTAPIVAAGTAAVAAFGEVDNAMDTVLKKTGATGEALEEMQKTVENLATTIPTDFDTAANAVGEINTRFGLTGQALEDLSAQFIKFADLNNTDVSSSVDKTQKLMAAFGVETKDAGKILDVLNSTGQKTGISIDKLSDLLVTNAATLSDLGLNAASAADFLGAVEMSGADTSVVMRGLQTAYKKAAKDGKTLNQALKEFSISMQSNKSDTEKTQDAIELFGTKAGPAIKKAMDEGTLSLDGMAESLDAVAGNVEKTFEGTLDGVDNWKMAMNEVKLIGADIGGILSEFAGPILTKVRDALTKARNAWRGLSDDQQDNIIKIAGIVAAMGPALTLVGKMTSAVGSLSKGIGLLIAHPAAAAFIGITAAIGGTVIAIKNHTDAVREAYDEEIGLTKEVKSLNEAIKEQNEAYKEAVETKNSTVDATEAEYDHLQKLAEEYDGYLQKHGDLTEKEQERAAFIENELCDALGLERDELQKIIDKNGELSTSIGDVIEKRKAQAVLNRLESDYSEAIVKSEDALTNLLAAENAREQQQKKIDGYKARRLEVEKALAAATDDQGRALNGLEGSVQAYRDELLELDNKIEDSTAVMGVMDEAVDQAKETYEGYQTTIKNYEGISAAIIDGDTTKISKSMDAFRQDFKTTETATKDTLKRQVTTLQTEYDNMKAAVERGDKNITEADLREKAYWLRQAQLEYNKAQTEARNAANNTGQAYANGIASKRSAVQDATRSVTGGAKTVLDGARWDAERSGSAFVDGFINKINAGYWRAQNAGRQLGGAAANALDSRLRINSPSKVTAESGHWFTEGFALGIEKDAQAAIAAASSMAGESANALNQQAQASVVAANPYADGGIVGAFRSAMSGMKVILDDEVAGAFVEDTVSRAVYQL